MKLLSCTVNQFKEKLQNQRKVICFGFGGAFVRMLDKFSELHLEENIKIIIDNSSAKWNTNYTYRNETFKIISPNEITNFYKEGDVILITSSWHEEIIQQLENMNCLDNAECYIFKVLKALQCDFDRDQLVFPENIRNTSEIMIPKIIHYCWFGNKELPEKDRKCIESWKKYCPEYEIIQWNESNYDIEKNKYMKQAYEMKKWGFVPDYARLDIIYNYGGIYVDTDVEFIRNIDELLYQKAFCAFEDKDYVALGLGFGAVKHFDLIKEMLEVYDDVSFINSDGSLNCLPSPSYQTKVMDKYGLKHDGKYQIIKDMAVYPEKMLCGMSPYSYQISKKLDGVYMIHHYAGSWLDDKEVQLKNSFQNIINSL